MSDANANGLSLIEGALHVPRVGAWRAELELDGSDESKATGKVTLVAGDTTWAGTSVEVGTFVGRVKVRIVGGAAGLAKATKPRFYNSMPARVIIADLLTEGGEALSTTSDATKLGTILPFWTRHAGTVSEGLENVLAELGAVWRVLADGTIWIGTETWPTASPANVIVEHEAPENSQVIFSSDSPSLVPGTTFLSRKVGRVEHSISPGKTRTTATFEVGDGSASADPMRAAIGTIVRQETKHVDFFAVRAGQVISQNDDYTLELKLDDPDFPGMSKIPIAYGVPGIKAKVKKGARVHVEFAEGSPTKPRAVVVDSDNTIELHVTSADVKIAGAGDFVALAQKVDDAFKQWNTWATALSVPTGVGPSGPPIVPPPNVPSVACTKLKTD